MPEFITEVVCHPRHDALPFPAAIEVLDTLEAGSPGEPPEVTIRTYSTTSDGAAFALLVMQILQKYRYELVRFSEPLINREGLAKEYGVKLSTVDYWLRDESFPRPVADVKRGRVWNYHTVERWLVGHGYRDSHAPRRPLTWMEAHNGVKRFESMKREQESDDFEANKYQLAKQPVPNKWR